METTSDVPHRVVQAGRKLFFARGFAKTPLRAIATEAGTSESGVLRFYRDKNEVLYGVLASCWDEVNAVHVEALRASAKRDSDPRSQLVDLAGAMLRLAETDRPMIGFLVNHFHFSDAVSLGGARTLTRRAYLDGYRDYRTRMADLCARVVDSDPGFGESGITPLALTHLVLSLIHGVMGGWYMAERDNATHGERLTVEEVLALLRSLLFQYRAD